MDYAAVGFVAGVAAGEREDATPSLSVQWKGTDVCADLHCLCGGMSHVDAEGAYFIRCSHCQRTWEAGFRVALHERPTLPEGAEAVDADPLEVCT